MDDIDVDDVDEITSDEMDENIYDEVDAINIEEMIAYDDDDVEPPIGAPAPPCFNVALIGHWQHGKTIFLDMLTSHALAISTFDEGNGMHTRFTDTRVDEQKAQMSVKTICDYHTLADSNSTLYQINFLDSPGHVNFSDEMTAALRLADGAVLVVDAADGVMVNTTRAIHHAVTDGLPIVVVINKVDRLITDLKLSPEEAYCKLRRIIEVINNHISEMTPTDASYKKIDPAAGNVCFASGSAGWCFTLQSFARLYTQLRQVPFHADRFVTRLWGDYSYNSTARTFKKELSSLVERSFVSLILKPLYNIYNTHLTKDDKSELKRTLAELYVYLNDDQYELDARPLLKVVISSVFGSVESFIDMLVHCIPSAKESAAQKVNNICVGPKNTLLYNCMLDCNRLGPLMVDVIKFYSYSAVANTTYALGRVYSGILSVKSLVQVLREGNHPDEENWVTETITVTGIWIHQAGTHLSIQDAHPGSCVYFSGFGDTLERTATLHSSLEVNPLHAFRPLQFNTLPVLKIAVSVKSPLELPRLIQGISMINNNYPLASVSRINSLHPTIICTGSKCLDFILREISYYSGTQVEVSGPTIAFCETVMESSIAEMRGQNFEMKMVVEPLEPSAAEDMENGVVRVDMPREKLGNFFQVKYDWDMHDATSIWAFGPGKQGPNILLDYTCLQEVDQTLLDVVKGSIVKGFQQGLTHGPLCNERVRNVKFKIVDVTIAPDASQHDMTHISQIVQRVAHSAICKAKPLLMEPVYYVEIQTPHSRISSIHQMLYERCGDIIHDVPQLESTGYVVKAFLPVRRSYDFEETLERGTNYEAFATLTFDHWTIVPGDPLDSMIESEARKCMVEIRHNKGMLDDPQALLVEQDDSDQQH